MTTKNTLDADFIADRKKELLKERDTLKKGLSRFAEKDPNDKNNYVTKFPSFAANDEADRNFENAEEVEEYTNNIGTENVLELRLLAVERALERIANNTYGQCSNCEATQSKERLKADPAAERCLDCGKSL